MLKIGSVVDGKYKILNEIGHGGMSNVYLAINEKANKPWAVKEVRKSLNRDFNLLRQSLIRETDLLKKLHHPNLPSIVDVISSDENFLIVMDYRREYFRDASGRGGRAATRAGGGLGAAALRRAGLSAHAQRASNLPRFEAVEYYAQVRRKRCSH